MENNESWIEILQIMIEDIICSWKIILLFALVCGSVADIAISLSYTPSYRSEATFAIKMNNQYATSENVNEIEDIATTFGYIISSNVFKEKIISDIDMEETKGVFETSVLNNTNIIRIAAISNNPKYSYKMMISMLNHYQEISKLVLGNVNIELMQNISIPQAPYNVLNHKQNFIRFAGLGMLISIVVRAMLSYFKDTVKTKEDMEKLQLKALGMIPKERKWYFISSLKKKKTILITQISTSFKFIEEIKKARSKIEHECEKHGYKVILVTSSLENEGKSSVLSNLGLALAMNHKKVLLIDGDLRKPALHKIFEQSNQVGIHNVLEGKISLEKAITHDKKNQLDFLFGDNANETWEKLDGKIMKNIIEEAKQQYDYILVDSVPSALFIDGVSLAKLCDAQLLVVRQNFVSIKIISETLDRLQLSNTPVLGYILNRKQKNWIKQRSGNLGYYHYGNYGYGRKKGGETHE